MIFIRCVRVWVGLWWRIYAYVYVVAVPHRAHHISPINLKISWRSRHKSVQTIELKGIQYEFRMIWFASRRRINIRHEMQLSWSIPTLNSVINQIHCNSFYARSTISDFRIIIFILSVHASGYRHAEFQDELILIFFLRTQCVYYT